MKKRIIPVIVFIVFIAVLSSCGAVESEPGELQINWVDPGIDCESLKFQDAGEGLYLLEAVIADGISKFGYMDGTGSIVISLIYDFANVFTEGLACVEADGQKWFIDPSGSEVLDVSQYGYAAPFEFGYSAVTRVEYVTIESGVRLTHLCGAIDKAGKEALPCEFEEAGVYENGIFWGMLDGKYAIFDNSGRRLTPHEYDYISYANEDLIIAQKDEKFGYLDKKGNVAMPFEHDMAGKFFDGCAFVADGLLAGYINTKGEQITPIEFDGAEDFSEGLAAVSKNGEYGYIDTQGNIAVPFYYDEAWAFKGGVAIVIKRVGSSLTRIETIDKNGEAAIIPSDRGYYKWKNTYAAYNNPDTGYSGVNFNTIALLSDNGERLTGFDFTEIFDFREGIAVSETSDDDIMLISYGLINQSGAIIIPMIYERIAIFDKDKLVVQFAETDPETGAVRSKVGIAVLPGDAAVRKPPALEDIVE